MNFNWLKSKNKRNSALVSEVKTFDIRDALKPSLSGLGNDYNVSLLLAQFYYRVISPVATGIDMIGDEFQAIKPLIYDPKTKEFTSESALLDLLTLPNSDQTRAELLGSIIRFFLMNGNAFFVATGDINRKPLELVSINPVYITPFSSLKDMFVDYYLYQSQNISVRFDRIEENGRFRYVNKEKNLELWPIRDFGDDYYNRFRGLSRLNAIYLEIEQYFSSNKHNLSILKKGVRSAGILMSDKKLTADVRDDLKAQVNADYAGDVNAGRIFLLDGGIFDFKELSKSLKDMDFKDLKKEIAKSIFIRLKIPLPLISTENQKFSNMFQATLGLYDNAVIPLIEKIFNEMALFLFPRYGLDPTKETLWFSIFDVQALKERHIAGVLDQKEKGVITLNEARKQLNYEIEIEGGDTVYQPINLVPVGASAQIIDGKKSMNFKKAVENIKYKNGENLYEVSDGSN